MRILQLITLNQLRGAEVFAAQLSDELAARGHQVVLAHLVGEGGRLSTGTGVEQVGFGGKTNGGLPLDLAVWRGLRRLTKELDPDVVQANGSDTLLYAALPWVVARSQPVVYRNISVMSMWAGTRAKHRVVSAALRRMSHIASVTEVGVRDLVQNFGVPESRVSVIPIGVSLAHHSGLTDREAGRARAREELGLALDAPVIVHVGSFTAEKNHAQLVEAFAAVAREMPEVELLLIGDGPLRGQIEKAVADAGLASRVRFTGVVPDAARLILAGDVLALPSLREGLPGVILEAGAARVPVVAYDVGGVPEVVEDGVTGVLVKKGDAVGLAEGLLRLLAEPDVARRLAEAARGRVAADFSLASVTERFEDLYARLRAQGG